MTTDGSGSPIKPSRSDWRPNGWPDNKLSVIDRKTVAEALGKIAKKIDGDKPSNAAKKMIEKAEVTGLKQHRHFKFDDPVDGGSKPGRAKAPDSQYEEPYASRATNYVKLAKAGFAIEQNLQIPTNDNPEWQKYETEVFRNTAFFPDGLDIFEPSGLPEIIVNYLDSLEAVVRQTGIDHIWQKLREQPFDWVEDSEDEKSKPGQFTDVRKSDGDIPGWAIPSFRLGEIAYPLKIEALQIPDDLRSEFLPDAFVEIERDDDELLRDFSGPATEWLSEQGLSREDFTNGESAGTDDQIWKAVDLLAIAALRLRVATSPQGSIRYRLIWQLLDKVETGDHRVSLAQHVLPLHKLFDPEYSAWTSICLDGCGSWLGLLVDPNDGFPRFLIRNWFAFETEWFGRYNEFEKSGIDDHDVEWFCHHAFLAGETIPSGPAVALPISDGTLLYALLQNEGSIESEKRFSVQVKHKCDAIAADATKHYAELEGNLERLLQGMASSK